MNVIRSKENPVWRRIRAARSHQSTELLLEGERLILDAAQAGVELGLVVLSSDHEARQASLSAVCEKLVLADPRLLARASGLTHSPGMLALAARPKPRDPKFLGTDPSALVLVAAGLMDPGNLGALARSAEAAGVSALCVVAGGASPWGEKALRGSMGSLLRLPVLEFETADRAQETLNSSGFRSVIAATRGGTPWREFDWSGRRALWIGSETGDSAPLMGDVERVSIPMAGAVESLNVSVAASVLIFSAGRVVQEASRVERAGKPTAHARR